MQYSTPITWWVVVPCRVMEEVNYPVSSHVGGKGSLLVEKISSFLGSAGSHK